MKLKSTYYSQNGFDKEPNKLKFLELSDLKTNKATEIKTV